MPLLFVSLNSIPEPYTVINGDSPQTRVRVATPVALTWQDGTAQTWAADKPVTAVSAYGGVRVDSSTLNWLLVAVKGADRPSLVKELDRANLDTLLNGASWAPFRLLLGGLLVPIPQFS